METYRSSGAAITKAITYFSGLEITGLSWSKGRTEQSVGGGFYLLAKSDELSKEYHEHQSGLGYVAKHGSLLLYKYKEETTIEAFDDPFQEFIKIAVALCLENNSKVYPFSFAVINDIRKPISFYTPRNYLPADDFNDQSGEILSEMTHQDLSRAIKRVPKLTSALQNANNTKIKDALNYYAEYLRVTDPKFQLVLLGMILEVLFIEDDSTSEIQTKLMVRVARFLYPASAEQRRKICDFVKKIYNIRSHVLHGSEYQKVLHKGAKKQEVSPQQYLKIHISTLEKLVSETLKKILASTQFFALMSRYPRNEGSEIREFYSKLVIG